MSVLGTVVYWLEQLAARTITSMTSVVRGGITIFDFELLLLLDRYVSHHHPTVINRPISSTVDPLNSDPNAKSVYPLNPRPV